MEGSSVSRRLLMVDKISDLGNCRRLERKVAKPIEEHIIRFPCDLDKSANAGLVIKFIKHLLCRRGALSQPFDLLLRTYGRKRPCPEDHIDHIDGNHIRCGGIGPSISNKAASFKERRHEAQREQSVSQFSTLFSELEAALQETPGASRVLLLFGATPVTPRESYLVQLPICERQCAHTFVTNGDRSADSGAACGPALCKVLLRSEFLDRDQSALASSKFMVFVEAPRNSPLHWFLPFPSFRVPHCKFSCRVVLGNPDPLAGSDDLVGDISQLDVSGVVPLGSGSVDDSSTDLCCHSNRGHPESVGEEPLSSNDAFTSSTSQMLGLTSGSSRSSERLSRFDEERPMVDGCAPSVSSRDKENQVSSCGADGGESDMIWYRAPVYIPALRV